MVRTRFLAAGAAVVLVLAACGGGDEPGASEEAVAAGLGEPRWVNDRVAVFVQLDERDPAKATALRYLGVSVKGVFCAENQPGGPRGGFPHFHRLNAAEYAQGHGGPPGTPGYWLSWVAVDQFAQRHGRQVKPGVDYEFSPTTSGDVRVALGLVGGPLRV